MNGTTGPRGEVHAEMVAPPPGTGARVVHVRSWSRTLRGVPHVFRAIRMPNGERRYTVRRYNGYGDDGTDRGRELGMRFGCAWSPVAFWTVPAPAGECVCGPAFYNHPAPGVCEGNPTTDRT